MTIENTKEYSVKKDYLDYSLFPKWDLYFSEHLNKIFFISVFLLILFGTLLFDLRISDGGDDSGYMLEAMQFSKGESFPNFHGIFYILLIGSLIKLFGFHLIIFKVLSFLFLIGHQFFFFYSFRRRISPFLLSFILIFLSLSSGLLYFGSQTYTEAFFLLLQGILFFFFINRLRDLPNNFRHVGHSWKYYLTLGFLFFMLAKTRNIGMVAIFAVLVYFIFQKKFFPATFSLASYLIFNIPYSFYKHVIWDLSGSDVTNQLSVLLQKNPYNKSLGYEDFPGMIVRFFENSKIYLSRIFMQEIGLKNASSENTGYFLTFLVTALLILGLVVSYRNRNKIFQFLFIYLVSSLGVTFISLNQMWSQNRLIIIYIPLMLLGIFWALAQVGKMEKYFLLRILVISLALFITFKAFSTTVQKVRSHQEIFRRNIKGDEYYGYTPDMANFLKISKWSAQQVPENFTIGSRKPEMSFISGEGRLFYPMYKLPFIETDSILEVSEKTEDKVVFINDLELELEEQMQVSELKRNMRAIISFDTSVYSLFHVPEENILHFDSLINTMKHLHPIYSLDIFKKEIVDNSTLTTTLLPDELISRLFSNNVHYLINAELRAGKNGKTDQTLNTVDRWMIAISSKYPGVFQVVKQIGDNKNEPARLYQLDYKKCRELGWKPE